MFNCLNLQLAAKSSNLLLVAMEEGTMAAKTTQANRSKARQLELAILDLVVHNLTSNILVVPLSLP